MLAVERLLEKPTVQPASVELLTHSPYHGRPVQALPLNDADAMVYLYVRGYWLTRYLAETQSELLRRLLERPRTQEALEKDMADTLGLEAERFWEHIDPLVAAHFESLTTSEE